MMYPGLRATFALMLIVVALENSNQIIFIFL